MSLKKGRPGEGCGQRPDSFSYVPVPHGLKNAFNAWVAGEVFWCEAHEHTKATPGTKPCLHYLTDGAVRCGRCRPKAKTSWIGWAPLYREQDHRAVIVMLHESALDLLTGLSYPDFVLVGRVDEKSSVFIRKSDTRSLFKTENSNRKKAIDITPDLLTMWRLPELDSWLDAEKRKPRRQDAVSAADVETESSGSVPLVNNRLIAAFDHAAEESEEKAKAAKRNRDFVRQVAAGSVNGKHKPEGGGS